MMIRERRRAIRKRRRRNQIIRRCALFIFMIIVISSGIKSIVKGNGSRENDGAEMNRTSNQDAQQWFSEKKDEPEESGEICVIVDAGHGGKDPGTLWETAEETIYEKDINLAIAKRLEQLLTEAGCRVVMTRTEDEKMVLEERVQIAKAEHADLFISIHQNALERDTVTEGIQVYCCRESNPDSCRLADAISDRLLEETGANDKGVKKDSDFFVLINNEIPACLVETGFITSTQERQRLLDGNYQQKIAEGIAKGVLEFLGEIFVEKTNQMSYTVLARNQVP